MEIPLKNTIQDNIKELFDNASYYSRHSDDIWITTLATVVVIGLVIYLYIKSTFAGEKANWEYNKCNPLYMPFASMINGGSDDMNEDNLKNCFKDLTRSIANDAMGPINASSNMFSSILETLSAMSASVQEYIMYLYSLILAFFKELMLRVQRIAGENIIIFTKINNFIGNILGFVSLMYYNLTVIIDSIKLIFPMMALSFLIGVIMPAIVSLVVSIVLLAVFYVIAVTLSPVFCIGCWAWGPVAIWLIVVIFMTIFVIFILTLYVIFSETCNNILRKLLAPISTDDDKMEFKDPPPEPE